MQTLKIVNRFTDLTLFEAEAEDLRALLVAALRAGADMTDADLRGAVLTRANLTDADLTRADLTRAVLRGVDLTDADLTRADLTRADLTDADLTRADLTRADLTRADLTRADMTDADLTRAVLTRADMTDTDLTRAVLTDAVLTRADMTDADLTRAVLDPLAAARLSIVPAGTLVGWKKCRGDVIVRLEIPAAARRSNATGRKCRAEFATVMEIEGADEAVSQHDPLVTYRVGETVRCHEWDECRWNECSGGIHFFLTREEAEAY